jgi:hypothetical protein
LLEQPVDPLRQRLDDLRLTALHLVQVQADLPHGHPVLGQAVAGFGVPLARFQQRFAGDAADAQACPAQLGVFVDAGDRPAELRGSDRCDIPAGTAAKDNQVVLMLCHDFVPW